MEAAHILDGDFVSMEPLNLGLRLEAKDVLLFSCVRNLQKTSGVNLHACCLRRELDSSESLHYSPYFFDTLIFLKFIDSALCSVPCWWSIKITIFVTKKTELKIHH